MKIAAAFCAGMSAGVLGLGLYIAWHLKDAWNRL